MKQLPAGKIAATKAAEKMAGKGVKKTTGEPATTRSVAALNDIGKAVKKAPTNARGAAAKSAPAQNPLKNAPVSASAGKSVPAPVARAQSKGAEPIARQAVKSTAMPAPSTSAKSASPTARSQSATAPSAPPKRPPTASPAPARAAKTPAASPRRPPAGGPVTPDLAMAHFHQLLRAKQERVRQGPNYPPSNSFTGRHDASTEEAIENASSHGPPMADAPAPAATYGASTTHGRGNQGTRRTK